MKPTIVIAIPRSGHNFIVDVLRSWTDRPLDVQGYENLMPEDFHSHKHNVTPGENYEVIVLVRDLLNWAASWCKYSINQKFSEDSGKINEQFKCWLLMALEALGETNYIHGNKMVGYEEFVLAGEYRKIICNYLGGRYTEDALNLVPNKGHGSSFDKLTFNGKGSEMKVTERWKWFLTDQGKPFIKYLTQNSEILQYYYDTFLMKPNQRRFIESVL